MLDLVWMVICALLALCGLLAHGSAVSFSERGDDKMAVFAVSVSFVLTGCALVGAYVAGAL